jgi:hypothetical protein
MTEPPRRFPPPWRVDRIPGGLVVRDANGQAIAYLFSREDEAEALQAKELTMDEARRIELVGKADREYDEHRPVACLRCSDGEWKTPRSA